MLTRHLTPQCIIRVLRKSDIPTDIGITAETATTPNTDRNYRSLTTHESQGSSVATDTTCVKIDNGYAKCYIAKDRNCVLLQYYKDDGTPIGEPQYIYNLVSVP